MRRDIVCSPWLSELHHACQNIECPQKMCSIVRNINLVMNLRDYWGKLVWSTFNTHTRFVNFLSANPDVMT